MFVPIKAEDYWTGDHLTVEEKVRALYNKMHYGEASFNRPYYCETSKKWLLVWKPLPYEEAIQASREYHHILPMILGEVPHAQAMSTSWYAVRQSALQRANKRPPIKLWEPVAIDPHVLECLVERADPYHESSFPAWEKYPHVFGDVYNTVATILPAAYKSRPKHPRWYEGPSATIGTPGYSVHEYCNWITHGVGAGPRPDRHPFKEVILHDYQEEAVKMAASFAMFKALRASKLSHGLQRGMAYVASSVNAMKEVSQSPGRTPFPPPYFIDEPDMPHGVFNHNKTMSLRKLGELMREPMRSPIAVCKGSDDHVQS